MILPERRREASDDLTAALAEAVTAWDDSDPGASGEADAGSDGRSRAKAVSRLSEALTARCVPDRQRSV